MGLALVCLALLLLPATASAQSTYEVLVVTSAQDELSAAGVAAIQAAAADGGFTVTAPAPADVGEQFTTENLERYSAVVFLNTGMASPLTDAERARFEEYFHDGGGFVGIGSAIETDASWQFLSDILGARSSGRTAAQSGTVKVYDRVHDASKALPEYWERSDHWYNFTENVRGVSHVLATVVEDPFAAQPQGQPVDGIEGGTMGYDHPVSWCKDYRGGRSFYTALGNTPASFDAGLQTHLKGAIRWAAGQSDPEYSDCGATVLANYEQTKISAPPNLNEPIGFDQLPDGRIIQTARTGTVRLHDPVSGTTQVIADFADESVPLTQRIYTNSEDGLYGPAIDRNFAQNKWVYLYYSPQTVTDVKLSTGEIVTQTTPTTNPPASAPSKTAWDPYVGYFQLSRFKVVEDAGGARLDLSSEQQILRVPVNRQECCHVAGDIDFDKHNNLWLVTGDDTPAGGINGGGMGPFNDQLTDERQDVRAQGATGGTFTLTFKGQTTAPLPFNATAAQIDSALEALSSVGENNVQVTGGPVNGNATTSVYFRRALQQADQPQITGDGSALTGATLAITTEQEGGWFQRPTGDARRGALNTNDLRGKVLRIKVKDGDIAAADGNKADFGSGGAYTIPDGNLFPLLAGAPQEKTRPEIYAMGFRNPFRIQVDENDVAYVSDYSPDSRVNVRGRGPAGTGRFEIVRKPANYGWPVCYKRDLGFIKWSHHEWPATTPLTPAPSTNQQGVPAVDATTPLVDCAGASIANTSRWNLEGGPTVEPGLPEVPPVTDPDIWYSYNDNAPTNPLGTPCAAYVQPEPGPNAPGSNTECPRLFPEFGTGGVGPHGSTKYHYDPDNPNPKKFPPYYDGSVILGEFTRDWLREAKLDSQNRIHKINNFLDCGAFASTAFPFECDSPMDMQFGEDGAFYLLTYGDGFFNVNPDAGMYKWEYVKGQRAPRPVLNTDRTDGPTPLTVHFSSEGTADPDPGDSIRIEWDFGDGTTSLDANPTHTYTEPGRYTAVLKVTDSAGREAAVSTIITVGNTSPTIDINLPLEGSTFTFGDKIPYAVTVTDPEDGAVACEDVQVTFVLGHDEHGHAEESKTGCSGSLQTLEDDVFHGGDVFGVINVRYTDKGGRGGVPSLTTIAETKIRQRKQQVEHATSQSGTNVGSNDDEGGGEHRGSLGNGDWIRLNGPFNLVNIHSVTFRVADNVGDREPGSPLAAVEIRTGAPDGPLVTTVNLTATGGQNVWQSQTFPISLAGLHDLYLVSRPVGGNNVFLLNYVEFNGPGASVVQTQVPGGVSGTVPATLSLSLGAPATFGAFTPGVARTYDAQTSASVISSAGDATLSVADPSSNATGHLVNGAFSLPQPLMARAASAGGTSSGGFASVGGSSNPTSLLSYSGPVSNDAVTLSFQQ
ncbi:MAG TPA: ThuA domain-containing protein, partial [Solirubrobacter sp.]|nr:ThuA domain-containing protein [Solirubrobacter sp.]